MPLVCAVAGPTTDGTWNTACLQKSEHGFFLGGTSHFTSEKWVAANFFDKKQEKGLTHSFFLYKNA
jgi:hypothetical protein